MEMPFLVKPYHLPILITMAFVLLSQSDARVGKKTKPSLSKPFLRHKGKQQEHGPGMIQPYDATVHPISSQIIGLSRRLYMELGRENGNITLVSDEFQDEFSQLNTATNGELGDALSAMTELRLLELQSSIRHARIMQRAVEKMLSVCPLCSPQQAGS